MPIGPDQLDKPTPLWVKIIYRSIFVFTTIVAFWVAGTHLVSDSNKYEVLLALKSIDPFVYFIGQMIGETPDKQIEETDFGESAKVKS